MKKNLQLFVLALLFSVGALAQNINVSGNISTNTTWSAASVDTVKVIGDLTIDSLVTLTIEPGIVVDFTDDYYLNVKGTLRARGTAVDSIRFTTSDTTGYAQSTHHGWSGIRIHQRLHSGDTTVLAYCVIEYGVADGSSGLPGSTNGGGLYTYTSFKVKLTHSTLRCNQATGEGGAWWDYYTMVNSSPEYNIVDCRFENNTAQGGGGAILTGRSFYFDLIGCEILNNTAAGNTSGGGLRNGPVAGHYSTVNMTGCRVAHNTANTGGALTLLGGFGPMNIVENNFHNNNAVNGGAIYCYQVPVNFQNNLVVNNESTDRGGGLFFWDVFSDGGGTTSTFANNTVAYNRAPNAGGFYINDRQGSGGSVFLVPNLYVQRCVFFGNESTVAGVNEDFGFGTSGNSNHTRFYSCSFTGDLDNGGVFLSGLIDDDNLHFTDPLFVSPSAGAGSAFDGYNGADWSLDFCASPCVDHVGFVAGYTAETEDYAGAPRILNGVTDIGAYEHPGFITQPQDLAICEGDTAVFSSTYYAAGGVNNSFWTFSPDGGGSWISAGYVDTFTLLTNAPASSNGLLIYAEHDFGCGQFRSDTALLTVYPIITTPVPLTICSNDSVFLEGAWQSTAGTYYDTLTSTTGCDSIIETTLTVNPAYHFPSAVSICQGDSILIYGSYQSVAGNYYDSLTTALGCDSVYQTTLVVNPVPVLNIQSVICSNDSLFAEGAWQNTTGIYYDTFQTTLGCDSIVINDLIVNPTSASVVDTAFCPGTSFMYNGVSYTQGGSYQQILTNGTGCDSVITLNLLEYTLPDADIGPDTIWACDGDVLSFGIDTTGVATYQISNFQTTSFDDSLSFIYDSFGGFTNVVSQVTGTNGCTNNDVVAVVSNEIVNMAMGFPSFNDPSVSFSIANMPSNVDFWYWSFGDGDTLSGDPNPTHMYTSNGSYTACLIAINACGIDSSCTGPFSIILAGIDEQELLDAEVFPNPTTGLVSVNFSTVQSGTEVRILDMTGKQLTTTRVNAVASTELYLDAAPGIYLVELITESGARKTIRLVKT